ncbi:MAG: DNA-3-methyladenine glycosylase [Bacteroidales bacterium]|jgi:DNA-3-methyladenine glycosylase|nr:DNA-3-methyladenine glycosylase [Bacteroidales bacterium]
MKSEKISCESCESCSPAEIQKLTGDFFIRDVLVVAPELLGKILVCKVREKLLRYRITETEAYRGAEDLACHANKGRTARTEVLFHTGGAVYVYLIYGMYWMLNFVTGREGEPQAALVRGLCGLYGPGRLTRRLQIDRSFYGEDVTVSPRIWVEDDGFRPPYTTGTRIGVDYSGEWKDKPWRFYSLTPDPHLGNPESFSGETRHPH